MLDTVHNALNYGNRIAFVNNKLSVFEKVQKFVYGDLRNEYSLKSQMAYNVYSVVDRAYISMKSNDKATLALYKKLKLQCSYNRDYFFLNDGIVNVSTF